MPKKQKWFWLAALIAAWLFDFLFWSKGSGVSFFIWIAILLLAGYTLAWSEGKKPSALSVLLTCFILGFAAVIALFIGSAILTASVLPCVFDAGIADVSAFVFELRADGVFAIGGFTAI